MTAPTPTLRHSLARAFALVAIAIAAILVTASPAAAHPTLLYTTPAAETADPTAPEAVVLVFGEPVNVAPGGLTVTDATGKKVVVDPPQSAKDGYAVAARLPQRLATGVYTVSWRVTGSDADLVEGRFRFAVFAALDPQASVDTATSGPSWPTTLYRFALIAGLALGVGGMVAQAMIRRARTLNPALPSVEGWTSVGAIAAAAAALALTIGLAADSGGLTNTPARIALIQAVGFIVIVIAQAVGRTGVTMLALAVIAASEAVRAHPNIAWPGWGALLTVVHITAAAIWAGTLIHVLRIATAWRKHPAAVRWLIFSYARLALWLVLTVVATGCVGVLLLVPLPTLATTVYGRLLLAKICLVAIAVTAAVLARRRLHRSPQQPGAPLRPARVEAAVLAGVLAVTASLTTTAPPADATAGQLPPPAPVGLVLPIGTLAGQIGVGVQASDGRLVVRLVTPSRQDYYATSRDTQTFKLTGRLIPAGSAETRELGFTGCGQGCYITTTDWTAGDNLITLHASAHGWTGGVVSLIIAWPVTDGAIQLTQAVAAMRTLDEVSFSETVTSDTSQPTGDPVPLRLPAVGWLTAQPYGTGVAPQVVVLPTTTPGQTRLALGYPAEARYVELTLDTQHRIIDEVQVDAKHVTRRHYVYDPPK